MYTEYIFNDKSYELGIRNLKSTLFDIVSVESSKLASIRTEISSSPNSELKQSMIQLCDNHEKNLLSILGIFDQLDKSIKEIDSFSKNLKEMQERSLAEIVTDYMRMKDSNSIGEVDKQFSNEETTLENSNEVIMPEPQIEENIEFVDNNINNENNSEMVSPEVQVNEEFVAPEPHVEENIEFADNNINNENNSETVFPEGQVNEKTTVTPEPQVEENIEVVDNHIINKYSY